MSGTIRSSNYRAGQDGWIIKHDGNAEFNNAVFRGEIHAHGNSYFYGDVTSGPLITSNRESGITSSPTVFNSNANARDICYYFNWIVGQTVFAFNFNNIESRKDILVQSGSFGTKGGLINIQLNARYYWLDLNRVGHHYKITLLFGDKTIIEREWWSNHSQPTIGEILTIDGGIPGKTFMLVNVPVGDNGLEPGTIYRDSGNILHIKT